MEEIKNNHNNRDRLFVTLMFLFAIFQLAFYKVMITTGDNRAHMAFSQVVLNAWSNIDNLAYPHMLVYPLYHLVVRLTAFFCLDDFEMAGMIVLTVSNLTSAFMMRNILMKLTDSKNRTTRYLIDALGIAYLFFETFAGPLTDGRIYARQCGPNPWHNPTITFVRPIGLIALCVFLDVMEILESKIEFSQYKHILFIFGLFSVLSVFAKPSFMMVFLPAMGIYVLKYWMEDFKGRFPYAMNILVAVLPTIGIILLQFLFCQFYMGGTVSPTKFQLGGFSGFRPTEILKVSLATFPVPLIALVLYRREMTDHAEIKVAYLALLFGWLEMFLLTNGGSGDYSWGYDLAVGVSTLFVLGKSLGISKQKWRRIPVLSVFFIQTVIGFYYVIRIYHLEGWFWF